MSKHCETCKCDERDHIVKGLARLIYEAARRQS